MVLDRAKGNPGIRFLLGILIIALSIYFFYVSMTRQNSPELFLVPQKVDGSTYKCHTVSTLRLEACIPDTLSSNTTGNNDINFYSIEPNMRGSIKLFDRLPVESKWKASLRSPFVRLFVGDVDSMDSFDLMLKILYHKWNPTLMGLKSRLMPSWMRGAPGACILLPPAARSIVFYSQEHSLGMRFYAHSVAVVSVTGKIDKDILVGIVDSIKPI